MEYLRRYADIVDDLPAFLEACERPLPRVVWANTLRRSAADLEARLLRRCPDAEPIPWAAGAWKLPVGVRPGNWLEYRLGLLQAQEEAALWAVGQLDLEPGQRVLDLCAAPGNKTAQIAMALEDRGLIVANEVQRGRAAVLRATCERLGLTSPVITTVDGRRYPDAGAPWDRALVDAPCSCEGTTRKNVAARKVDGSYRDTIMGAQIGLLRRAAALVRPGGIIVYATCTYAPEENERVLDALDPALVSIEPIEPPAGLRVAPGIPEWDGRRFRPDVVHAARVWPHHNDTGGFFVARLRRL